MPADSETWPGSKADLPRTDWIVHTHLRLSVAEVEVITEQNAIVGNVSVEYRIDAVLVP